jgi:hypothetical protein
MKVLHKLTSKDFSERSVDGLQNMFEEKSLSPYGAKLEAQFFLCEAGESILKVKGSLKVTKESLPEQLLTRTMIYFPEQRYGLEYIHQTPIIDFEFLYELRTDKDYFNLVVLDREGLIISSATYVFNHSSIIPYPIRIQDLSPLDIDGEIYRKDEQLIFRSTMGEDCHTSTILHTWQNVGQHVVLPASRTEADRTYESSVLISDMCSGMWMVIATDDTGRLLTQYVVQI